MAKICTECKHAKENMVISKSVKLEQSAMFYANFDLNLTAPGHSSLAYDYIDQKKEYVYNCLKEALLECLDIDEDFIIGRLYKFAVRPCFNTKYARQ